MKCLWEFDSDHAMLIVETSLSDLGKVSKSVIQTPYSRVFTIDGGPNRFPRYLVAKAPWFEVDGKFNRLEKFVHEAEQTVKIVGHPFLHRFGKLRYVQGVPFLISAKCDGTLEDVLAGPRLDQKEVLVIAIQIARGLGYCQHVGLIAHQDLKPANIFVDDLAAKFGPDVSFKSLARVADFELSNAYLDLGKASGSRPYMSPEQHLAESNSQGSLIDFSRADTFSFGVVLHELLTDGFHPVGEKTADVWPSQMPGKEKWKRSTPWTHWIKSGAPLKHPLDEISTTLRELIGNCLSTTPSARSKIGDVEKSLWDELARVSPEAHRGMGAATHAWEEGLFDESGAEWPGGEAILKNLRQSFANRE